jgi:acyl-CoA synthetase (AMP-forming)/AMP-acid ligase II
MRAHLARLLTDTAVKDGDRPAVKLDDRVVTYKMFDDGAARVAGLLKDRGVPAGPRESAGPRSARAGLEEARPV